MVNTTTMRTKLLRPDELDALLRYSPGKSERLARRGKIAHIRLPDGSIRFDEAAIESLIRGNSAEVGGVANGQ